jgi:tRNA threonylcarbamoyl adenosine modification protein (Sua5/YciO/YrdC/YwlC family)
MRVEIHPTHPQPRLIGRACTVLRDNGVVAYPTDSYYGIGCMLGAQDAIQRIRDIRRMSKHQFLTLVCRDLSELSTFARVDKSSYRLIKSLTPGPYTFILQATRELPRRLQDPKRKTIGLRIPDHSVTSALLTELASPMLSATARGADQQTTDTDPIYIYDKIGRRIDLLLDAGASGAEPTTVIDLSSGEPELVRRGAGAVEQLMNL